MKPLKYNREDKEDIIKFAKQLIGKSLSEVIPNHQDYLGTSGKGKFGVVLENGYFDIETNSLSQPDFHEVDMELKSSGLIKKNGTFKAKERVSLGMINYDELAKERSFQHSSLWRKNKDLLFVFYEYLNDKSFLEWIIRLVDNWVFPEEDLIIIRNDWNTIKAMVDAGNAHKISESLTEYLGACTKGANKASVRNQPYSTISAKNRAFSLKQKYVTHIIQKLLKSKRSTVSIINENDLPTLKTEGFIGVLKRKVSEYIGMSAEEINKVLGDKVNLKNSKNCYASLTKLMLGLGEKDIIEEFEKAEIVLRTIRLKPNGIPKEAISFPAFQYIKIIDEEWEESQLFELLDKSKFLFSIFDCKDSACVKTPVFKGIVLWSMPTEDIDIARDVWLDTRMKIQKGEVISKVEDSGIRKTNFIKISDERVIHVRPHGATAADTYPLPVMDKVTGKHEHTKHSFWLNQKYIANQINHTLRTTHHY